MADTNRTKVIDKEYLERQFYNYNTIIDEELATKQNNLSIDEDSTKFITLEDSVINVLLDYSNAENGAPLMWNKSKQKLYFGNSTIADDGSSKSASELCDTDSITKANLDLFEGTSNIITTNFCTTKSSSSTSVANFIKDLYLEDNIINISTTTSDNTEYSTIINGNNITITNNSNENSITLSSETTSLYKLSVSNKATFSGSATFSSGLETTDITAENISASDSATISSLNVNSSFNLNGNIYNSGNVSYFNKTLSFLSDSSTLFNGNVTFANTPIFSTTKIDLEDNSINGNYFTNKKNSDDSFNMNSYNDFGTTHISDGTITTATIDTATIDTATITTLEVDNITINNNPTYNNLSISQIVNEEYIDSNNVFYDTLYLKADDYYYDVQIRTWSAS